MLQAVLDTANIFKCGSFWGWNILLNSLASVFTWSVSRNRECCFSLHAGIFQTTCYLLSLQNVRGCSGIFFINFFFNFLESHTFPMKIVERIVNACPGFLPPFGWCCSKELLACSVEAISIWSVDLRKRCVDM